MMAFGAKDIILLVILYWGYISSIHLYNNNGSYIKFMIIDKVLNFDTADY